MTTPELIAELERLDAAHKSHFPGGNAFWRAVDIADEFRTHCWENRSRLLSSLRREAEAVKLLQEARGYTLDSGELEDRIDAFLAQSAAAKGGG